MPIWFSGGSKSSSPNTNQSKKKKGLFDKLKLKTINRDEHRHFSLDSSDGSGNWSETRSPTTPHPLPHMPSPLSPSDLVDFPSLPLPSPANPPAVEQSEFDFASGSTSSAGSQENSVSATHGPSELLFPSLRTPTTDAHQGFQRSGFGHSNVNRMQDYHHTNSPHASQRFSNSPLRTYSGSNHTDSSDRNGVAGRMESPARSPRGASATNQVFGNVFRGHKSPEHSPSPSPRRSPGPSPRILSTAVSPLHPKACAGGGQESSRQNEAHPLPLPPSPCTSNGSYIPVPSPYSAVPRSPERPINLQTGWRKGSLLGSGTFGHVYSGFHSESGQSCAIKEVLIIPDSERSKESAKQLKQEVHFLSQMKHANIVQYYGCEMVEDRLFIYLEFMSNGSIHNILQQYGPLSESCIRVYTRQILLGLAYLHGKNTVHRDIKGANILVDKGGEVKLADFGMAKHISDHSFLLSFKGSPYWMAPEVIRNKNGYSFAVDIWSLGCTVLEMATGKPPWSQFEGIAAVFKIGNSKDMPDIPEHLSEDTKLFLRSCLQRDPRKRPTAAQLLELPFVRLQWSDSSVSEVLTSAVQKLKTMETLPQTGTGPHVGNTSAPLSPPISPQTWFRTEDHTFETHTLSSGAPGGPGLSSTSAAVEADRRDSLFLPPFQEVSVKTPKSPRSPHVNHDGPMYAPIRTDSYRGGTGYTPESSPRRSSSVWDESMLGHIPEPRRIVDGGLQRTPNHYSQRFSQEHQPYSPMSLQAGSTMLVGPARSRDSFYFSG